MSRFFVGVDLGQVRDPTAIAVLEASDVLLVRYLERIPLATPYAGVVEQVRKVSCAKALDGRCRVVVDATGVGRPVVEMLQSVKLGGALVPVLVTGGRAESSLDGYHKVPKSYLLRRLLTMVENGRLHIADGLPEGRALLREITQIKVRTRNCGRARIATWRHGEHDDLVFAVALACWGALRERPTRSPVA
jgi:threonine dehydrogenase-like Zn-dependent dehydrogenase